MFQLKHILEKSVTGASAVRPNIPRSQIPMTMLYHHLFNVFVNFVQFSISSENDTAFHKTIFLIKKTWIYINLKIRIDAFYDFTMRCQTLTVPSSGGCVGPAWGQIGPNCGRAPFPHIYLKYHTKKPKIKIEIDFIHYHSIFKNSIINYKLAWRNVF